MCSFKKIKIIEEYLMTQYSYKEITSQMVMYSMIHFCVYVY
jgi:hypothetical protein